MKQLINNNSKKSNILSDKFITKYLRLAKFIAEDQNPCYARKVGAVIIDPINNNVVGLGYNGPPKHTPHMDHPIYLKYLWELALSSEEREKIIGEEYSFIINNYEQPISRALADVCCKEKFIESNKNKGKCPRKLLGYKSGERLDLCSCVHAEANAIINSTIPNLKGCYIFITCAPCQECTKLIINSGISKIYVIGEEETYNQMTNWLLKESNIPIQFIELPNE